MESTNLVGMREAARRLAQNPSTVSRQIATGIISDHGRVDAPLIDVEEARAARAARAGHLDRSKQCGSETPLYTGDGPAAAHLTEPDEDANEDDEETVGSVSTAAKRPSYTTARTAREGYQAKLAQFEYVERIGRLVDEGAVELDWTRGMRNPR